MADEVVIRHFCAESDAKAVHDIWMNGLEQTVQSKWFLFRPIWRLFFHIMARNAIKANGDVGPNGQNLFDHWCEDSNNRCLLVGEQNCLGKDEKKYNIVGCIVVIRGTDTRNNPMVNKEETTFSVWKMSVADEYRRQGIGRRLLDDAENWAKNNGCKKMKMITANPIASKFYQKQGYKPVHSNILFSWLGCWYDKDI